MTQPISASHLEYDEYQALRIVCLRVIEVAVQDALGKNLGRGINRSEIMQEAYDFFYDGRYDYYMGLLGLMPVIPPDIERMQKE